MKYYNLISELGKNKLGIFSLRDIENLFPKEKLKTIKNNLTRWVKEGRLARLRRDLYEFIEPGLRLNVPDVYVSNRLYSPSYVSLETAMSIYGLIPDVAAQVTSVTTLPTREFKNKYGLFTYKSCQKRAFTGYKLMEYEGTKILIADREKALVDFIYFSFHKNGLNLEDERFNRKELKKLNWNKMLKYDKFFNNKTMTVLKNLKEWAGC